MTNEERIKQVEEVGLLVAREVHGFTARNVDLVFPYTIMTLCLSGSARSLYDMHEITQRKNELGIIMPGHILRPIECSKDYTFARIVISPKMIKDLQFHIITHDYEKFHYAPMCTLTDIQVERLLYIVDHLKVLTEHSLEEMPHRYGYMLMQLASGYEILNYYRREQDRDWAKDRNTFLFHRFCELVVAHYKESRETQFYARLLNLSPKYFSQLIRMAANGMSPGQWIDQYVTTQAKQLIRAHPEKTLQEIAFMVGFSEPSAFYRYFKRVTGVTAKKFRTTRK